jgi:hypothetical protein
MKHLLTIALLGALSTCALAGPAPAAKIVIAPQIGTIESYCVTEAAARAWGEARLVEDAVGIPASHAHFACFLSKDTFGTFKAEIELIAFIRPHLGIVRFTLPDDRDGYGLVEIEDAV